MDPDAAYWWFSRAVGSVISIGLIAFVTRAWHQTQRGYRQFLGCMAFYFLGDVIWNVTAEMQDALGFSIWWVILGTWVQHLAGVAAMICLWILYVETRALCAPCAPAKVNDR